MIDPDAFVRGHTDACEILVEGEGVDVHLVGGLLVLDPAFFVVLMRCGTRPKVIDSSKAACLLNPIFCFQLKLAPENLLMHVGCLDLIGITSFVLRWSRVEPKPHFLATRAQFCTHNFACCATQPSCISRNSSCIGGERLSRS